MRRRMTRGAGLVVAASAILAVAAAVTLPMVLRPAEAGAKQGATMPWDTFGEFVDHCMRVFPEADRYSTIIPLASETTRDGQVRVVMGRRVMEEPEPGSFASAGEPTVDAAASELMNECLNTEVMEEPPVYREPTRAERLVLYDWVSRFQEPCLAAHGVTPNSFTFSVFMSSGQHPWTMPQLPGSDFETRLALRLACPPIPEHLHLDGIVGY